MIERHIEIRQLRKDINALKGQDSKSQSSANTAFKKEHNLAPYVRRNNI